MAVEWSNSLSTGIEWQDRQHKELFRRMNSLMDAMDHGRGKDEVGRLFKFLDEYFVSHFDAEEQVMHRYDYPGALAHISEHTKLIEDISKLKDEFSAGSTTSIVIKTQRRVVDWFINHIGEVDKVFARYVLQAENEKKGRG